MAYVIKFGDSVRFLALSSSEGPTVLLEPVVAYSAEGLSGEDFIKKVIHKLCVDEEAGRAHEDEVVVGLEKLRSIANGSPAVKQGYRVTESWGVFWKTSDGVDCEHEQEDSPANGQGQEE